MAEMFPKEFPYRYTKENVDKEATAAGGLTGSQKETADKEIEKLRQMQAGESGEALVYNMLAAMPASWAAFHSVRLYESRAGNNMLNREIDFVILVPKKGVICLEVKHWNQERAENCEYEGSPAGKAYDRMNAMQDWLTKIHGFKSRLPEFSSAAIMTHGYTHTQSGHPEYLCGRKVRDKKAFQDFILSRFSKSATCTPEAFSELRGLLTLQKVCRISLDDYLDRMNRATAPIEKMLPMLEESEGDISVTGGAGTGKTVMATREAVRLAATGKKVLFLCFNKNLAHCLRQDADIAAQIAAGKLRLNNFHALCTDILGTPFHKNLLSEQQAETVAEALAQEQYDAIFVDEAQDFSPQWWDVTEWALKDKGRWYLFYDEKQVLRNGTRLRHTAIRIRLRTNLRNTVDIANYGAKILGDSAPETLQLRGPKVQVLDAVKDSKERAAVVQKLVSSLLRGELPTIFAPKRHQIVILSPWQPKNDKSCAAYLKGINVPTEQSKKDPATAAARYHDTIFNPKSKEILYETIKAFKGLESDFIILTDIRKPNSDPRRGFTPAEFYVAATRARYGLYVVPME